MSLANNHLSRWKRRLAEVAWRRTPGRRAWDLLDAKVIRFLIARYERNKLIGIPPAAPPPSAATLPAPQSIWRPRTGHKLRTRLNAIQVANVPSYREFATIRSRRGWKWWR